jgi:hypothetical protein
MKQGLGKRIPGRLGTGLCEASHRASGLGFM